MRAHDFSVIWLDPGTGEKGVVAGEEHMYDWAEAEEVASHFRREDDGLEYAVGQLVDGEVVILDPPMEEIEELLLYLERYTLSAAELKMLRWVFEQAQAHRRSVGGEVRGAAQVTRRQDYVKELEARLKEQAIFLIQDYIEARELGVLDDLGSWCHSEEHYDHKLDVGTELLTFLGHDADKVIQALRQEIYGDHDGQDGQEDSDEGT